MSLLAIFIASILGSPHCAGMCGGFVCFYSGQCKDKAASHVLYNIGRLITYTTIGAVSGFLGNSVNSLVGSKSFIAVLLGGMMVAIGALGIFGVAPSQAITGNGPISKRLFGKVITNRSKRFLAFQPLLLGGLSTLLPCAWLYTFVGIAGATSSIFSGILVMFTFWLGTLPMMVSIGVMAKQASFSFFKYFPKLSYLVLIGFGIASILGHLSHESIAGCH